MVKVEDDVEIGGYQVECEVLLYGFLKTYEPIFHNGWLPKRDGEDLTQTRARAEVSFRKAEQTFVEGLREMITWVDAGQAEGDIEYVEAAKVSLAKCARALETLSIVPIPPRSHR